jgi:hypothetical protein
MRNLLDVLETAAATLATVASAAPPGARAYHNFGMADTSGFLAMGCDETLVHGWDAVRGLGEEFAPPAALAERVLRRLFRWAPTSESPWPALLWANERADLPGRERLGPDWAWHCAPLDEWDGAVPREDTNPPAAANGITMLIDGIQPGNGNRHGFGVRPLGLLLLIVCAQLVGNVRIWSLEGGSFPPIGGKRTVLSELGAPHDAR